MDVHLLPCKSSNKACSLKVPHFRCRLSSHILLDETSKGFLNIVIPFFLLPVLKQERSSHFPYTLKGTNHWPPPNLNLRKQLQARQQRSSQLMVGPPGSDRQAMHLSSEPLYHSTSAAIIGDFETALVNRCGRYTDTCFHLLVSFLRRKLELVKDAQSRDLRHIHRASSRL